MPSEYEVKNSKSCIVRFFFFMLFIRFLKNVSTQRHPGDFSPTFMYVLFLYVIFVQLCFKLPQRVPENMQFHLFAHKPRAVIQLL